MNLTKREKEAKLVKDCCAENAESKDMKKGKVTFRETTGLFLGMAGLMAASVVDGSPNEIVIRLAGVGLIAAGAWVGRAFCWQGAEDGGVSTNSETDGDGRDEAYDHDPYPYEFKAKA